VPAPAGCCRRAAVPRSRAHDDDQPSPRGEGAPETGRAERFPRRRGPRRNGVRLGEVGPGVVEDGVGPERPDHVDLRRAAHAADLGTQRLRDLHGETAGAAGRADDQNVLPPPGLLPGHGRPRRTKRCCPCCAGMVSVSRCARDQRPHRWVCGVNGVCLCRCLVLWHPQESATGVPCRAIGSPQWVRRCRSYGGRAQPASCDLRRAVCCGHIRAGVRLGRVRRFFSFTG
jgi:hypothetical protein